MPNLIEPPEPLAKLLIAHQSMMHCALLTCNSMDHDEPEAVWMALNAFQGARATFSDLLLETMGGASHES